MKELSIEQKAQRYDEAVEKLRSLHDDYDTVSTLIDIKEELENIFPELKESEDKRMIQYFKDLAPFDKADELYEKYGFSHKDAIAWLEKQELLTKEKALKNSPFVEHKPADKVESKFHEGDWVVYCNDDIDLITGIEENGYCINNGGYIPFVCESDIRLWTIEDAKDGDVLVASDGSIFIFKGTIDCACKHYVALTTDDVVNFNEGLEHYWETSIAVHPATKEQRNLLFQKMHEAGYEWDAEKKELKKIEQKSAEWSDDDEKRLNHIIQFFEDKDRWKDSERAFPIEEDIRWLKALKPQNRWKPSGEQMEALEYYVEKGFIDKEGVFGKRIVELYVQLKKLRRSKI